MHETSTSIGTRENNKLHCLLCMFVKERFATQSSFLCTLLRYFICSDFISNAIVCLSQFCIHILLHICLKVCFSKRLLIFKLDIRFSMKTTIKGTFSLENSIHDRCIHTYIRVFKTNDIFKCYQSDQF